MINPLFKKDKPKTAVIYARYSCEKQREESIVGQIRDCRKFAKGEGIRIVDVYTDEAFSARTANRPAFKKMIADSRNGGFDAVIVWKGDRFSRNREDSAKFKRVLANRGVRVLYAKEANIEGAEAILVQGVSEAMAEYFSVDLSEKVCRGMTENALSGKFNGGTMPFGYQLDANRHLAVNEAEAALIRELYDLYLNHDKSVAQITSEFQSRGVQGRKGGPITNSTLYRILGDMKYSGKYTFLGEEANNYYPKIIDAELIQQASIKKRSNQNERSRFVGDKKYLLSGKIYCGHDGNKMVGITSTSRNGQKYLYYVCLDAYRKHTHEMDSVPKEALEYAVFKSVKLFLKDKLDREKLANGVMEIYKADNTELARLEDDLKSNNSKIERLVFYLEDHEPSDALSKRLNNLEASKQKIEDAIAKEKRKSSILSLDQIKSYLDDAEQYGFVGSESMQAILERFVHSVYVLPDWKVVVFLKLSDYDDNKITLDNVRKVLSSVHQFETPRTLYCHQSGFVVVGYLPQRKSHKTSHP